MKKRGILNSEIAKIIDDLRHTDQIIIGDCGLPVPSNVKQIDISLELGTPSFYTVLEVLLKDIAVEKVILAEEMKQHNMALYQKMDLLFSDIDWVTHEEFKQLSKNVKAIIRTGENTPFANVILQSAVVF
ncbi:D-ribose pyranase [Paenilisteria rocourtiae]|uniref:D-ribose pyranase n=1 Tax=Listeria rocourtiae TaxID=647910 RepID=A0A4V3DPM1_9LIST|nr:D-ribose pyranase [Listeria rocourtiae]EUJ42798.1 D-ribose pyranase [Listeria rocourtiae FSL F6-920]MBC1433802.1 D-ribose pyranase [Listeria rocourtiae]TDR52806.1 ribose transport protein RbsD [Listeria rocourtiae]